MSQSFTRLAESLWEKHGYEDNNGPAWAIVGCVAAGLVLENRHRVEGCRGKPNISLQPRDTKDVDIYSLNGQIFGGHVCGWQLFLTDIQGSEVMPIDALQESGFYIDVWHQFFRGFDLPTVEDITWVRVESGLRVPVIRPEFQVAFKLLNARPPRVTDVSDALVVASAVELDEAYLARLVGQSSLGKYITSANVLAQLQVDAPRQFDYSEVILAINDEWRRLIDLLGLTELPPSYLLFLASLDYEACAAVVEGNLVVAGGESAPDLPLAISRLASLILMPYVQEEQLQALLEAAYIASKPNSPRDYIYLSFILRVAQFLKRRDSRVDVEQMIHDMRFRKLPQMHLVANQTANLCV